MKDHCRNHIAVMLGNINCSSTNFSHIYKVAVLAADVRQPDISFLVEQNTMLTWENEFLGYIIYVTTNLCIGRFYGGGEYPSKYDFCLSNPSLSSLCKYLDVVNEIVSSTSCLLHFHNL